MKRLVAGGIVVCASIGMARGGNRADTMDEAEKLVRDCKAPVRYAGHMPVFSAQQESFDFTADGKTAARQFWTIKDGPNYVAIVDEGICQLDMIAFDPARTTAKPPFAPDGYTWESLLGTRITTTPWYGDMRPTGDARQFGFMGGGTSLALTVKETWTKVRKAESSCVMVLRADPVLGYVWDIDTTLSTSVGTDAKGQPDRIEFFNWQVKVTRMGRLHDQAWPVAWTHERTVFHRDDDTLVGFYMNPEANERGQYRRTRVKDGGYVAMLPDATGWGVALVHREKGSGSCGNATCNMWADSHNYLELPAQPDRDGRFRVAAKWRFQALPPEAVAGILKRVEMDATGCAASPR